MGCPKAGFAPAPAGFIVPRKRMSATFTGKVALW